MEKENIIDGIIQAISILNKIDDYLDGLSTKLSECDSLISDYEHFIENTPIEEVNLEELYLNMQSNFAKRRIIKNNISLNSSYKNLTSKLNNSTNREFLIQNLKNIQAKLGTKYHNRVLTQEDLDKFKRIDVEEVKKKRGRPKKAEGSV